MSRQATARPWELRSPTRIYGNLQRDQNSTGDLVATCVEPETASLIVRAVNAHDAMLEALRQIQALPGEINVNNYDHDDVCALNASFIEAYQIAVAAISRALTGGEGK